MKLIKKFFWFIVLVLFGSLFIAFFRRKSDGVKKIIDKIIQKAETEIDKIDKEYERLEKKKRSNKDVVKKMSRNQLIDDIRKYI